MKIGSLCTGYGGLDLAVEAFFGAETIWCAENDKYASQVIEQRFGIANFGDIKTIKWETVPDIDILTAGYPCQPFSHAGERKGTDDPRHIFPYIAKAINALRPRYFIFENVRGHLSLGFKEVLEILSPMGYVIKWGIVRASDAGAPHRRERLFIFGELESSDTMRESCEKSRRTNRSLYESSKELIDGSNWHEYGCSGQDATDSDGEGLQRSWNKTRNLTNGVITDTDTTRGFGSMSRFSSGFDSCTYCDSDDKCKPHNRKMSKLGRRFASRCEMSLQTAPTTLVDGKLNAKFVEYMMGLPSGWVTDCGLSRSQQLKMLGNGVVPQQAHLALEILTNA